MKIEPFFQQDYYKVVHHLHYPPGTELVYSNLTPRKAMKGNDRVVLFGLQYYIKEYLIDQWNNGFFNLSKDEVVGQYRNFMEKTVGDVGWKHIESLHELGYLPLVIKAVPEGTMVPIGSPMLTLYNTKKEFYWLTNFLETSLSNILWKPCTSATTAKYLKKDLEKFAEETCDDDSHICISGHDFSYRGMSGLEDSCLSGGGHLLSFIGTDTIPAIRFLEQYYGADINKELVGTSVPANEHSVVSIGGFDNEYETFRRLLQDVHPTGILSLISDTYSYFDVLTKFLPRLKDIILNRKPGPSGLPAKCVIRADSGDQVKIVCGNPDSQDEDEKKGSLNILWDVFGGTINSKGYKVLNPYIGLIYGDGCSPEKINQILSGMKEIGFASSNIVFGVGSYTYEYTTRDVNGFAVKATYGEINGKGYNVFKDPKTDTNKLKKSHKGLMRLNEDMTLQQECTWEEEAGGILETVFEDGKLVRFQTLAEIREILKNQ